MKQVTAFAGSRADLSPLAPVLQALMARADVRLTLITALGLPPDVAPHVLADAGLDPAAYRHVPLDIVPRSGDAVDLARAGARLAAAIAEYIAAATPDTLVVLGDRWELLWVVPAFVVTGIPVVHLHGGEVTEGAIDDRVRHAITKLADEHCVATPLARTRLLALGEAPEHVHLTGAPGLDRLATAEPLSDSEFQEVFGHPLSRPLVLFTYHAVTAGDEPPAATAGALLDALDDAGALTVVTDPGIDTGREEILQAIAAREKRPSTIHVATLGRLYPRLLKTVDAVVGNSSSGIIESPYVGVPTLDVGVRQRGRDRGPGVRWCAATPPAIAAAVRELLGDRSPREGSSLYGQGGAAQRIAEVTAQARPRHKQLVRQEATSDGSR